MRSFRAVVRFVALFSLFALFGGQAKGGASMALHFGMAAGGELFRVVSPDEISGTRYATPDGRILEASEIRTELDETVVFGLRVRVPVKPKISVSVGLSAADMDVTAKRRTVTDVVDEISYDQMFVLQSDVSVEYDWFEAGNRPFLCAGLGVVGLDFEERTGGGESLDATELALIVGGGFRLRSLAAMDLDFEARGFRVSPSWDAEEERLVPAESFTGKDAIWLWQITAAAVYEF